jgi:hypothetical protein
MNLTDVAMIVSISLAISLIVTLVCGSLLRFAARMPLTGQLAVLVASTALTVMASVVTVARLMLISSHDLNVVLYVAIVASIVSLALSLILGRFVTRNLGSLTQAARQIGEGALVAADSPACSKPPARSSNAPERARRSWSQRVANWSPGFRMISARRSPVSAQCPKLWKMVSRMTSRATSRRCV